MGAPGASARVLGENVLNQDDGDILFLGRRHRLLDVSNGGIHVPERIAPAGVVLLLSINYDQCLLHNKVASFKISYKTLVFSMPVFT